MKLRTVVLSTLIVCCGVTATPSTSTSSYCRFSPDHTLCKYDGINAKCGNQIPVRGINQKDIQLIVNEHNAYRSRVAMGQELRGLNGSQPPASNMLAMRWDPELAQVAQRHADQCTFDHDCQNCRKVGRFNAGQNLYITFSSYNERKEWSRAVQSWYDEVKDVDPNHIEPFVFSTPTGHYTQLVWWNVRLVGCGLTMFHEDGWWKKLYTCNYGPAGNIIGTKIYEKGDPCSDCPEGTRCSHRFPGLCDIDQNGSASGGKFHTDNNIGASFNEFDFFNREQHNPQTEDKTKVSVINLSQDGSPIPQAVQDFLKNFNRGQISQTFSGNPTNANGGDRKMQIQNFFTHSIPQRVITVKSNRNKPSRIITSNPSFSPHALSLFPIVRSTQRVRPTVSTITLKVPGYHTVSGITMEHIRQIQAQNSVGIPLINQPHQNQRVIVSTVPQLTILNPNVNIQEQIHKLPLEIVQNNIPEIPPHLNKPAVSQFEPQAVRPMTTPSIEKQSPDDRVTIPQAFLQLLPKEMQATIKRLSDLYNKNQLVDNKVQPTANELPLSAPDINNQDAAANPFEMPGNGGTVPEAINNQERPQEGSIPDFLTLDRPGPRPGPDASQPPIEEKPKVTTEIDVEKTISDLQNGRLIPNSHVVSTSSVTDLRKILQSVPEGIKPLVLYRSSKGDLVQLDPSTLKLIQRRRRRRSISSFEKSLHYWLVL